MSDVDGEFRIERTIEVDASPEHVWQAVNTPQGLVSWLFPVDEPGTFLDGREPYAWGGHDAVTWQAPHHSVVQVRFADGGVNRLEYELTETDSGCSVRYVHSGTFVEDALGQTHGAERHTDFYLHSLDEYLRHFAPHTATGYVGVRGPDESRAEGSFERVLAAFGLDRSSLVGNDVSLDVPGIDPVRGTVDYLDDAFLGVRTEHELLRVYGREGFTGGMGTGLGHHLFREDADSGVAYDAWRTWLGGIFRAGD